MNGFWTNCLKDTRLQTRCTYNHKGFLRPFQNTSFSNLHKEYAGKNNNYVEKKSGLIDTQGRNQPCGGGEVVLP